MPRHARNCLPALIALAMSLPADGAGVPVALAWTADGRLAVALRDGRAVALVDPEGWKLAREWALPIRPASLAAIGGSALLVGGQDGEALVVDRGGAILHR